MTLKDLDGNEIALNKTKKITVEGVQPTSRLPNWLGWARPVVSPLSAEARVELSRLLFTLAIALVGVYAAARGKAESLEVLPAAAALIALGFGVDIAKTVLTQNSTDK